MFSLHDFIMDGLCRAIGKMADFQVILNAVGWHTKAVLSTEDLELLAAKIAEKDASQNLPAAEDVEVGEAAEETLSLTDIADEEVASLTDAAAMQAGEAAEEAIADEEAETSLTENTPNEKTVTASDAD